MPAAAVHSAATTTMEATAATMEAAANAATMEAPAETSAMESPAATVESTYTSTTKACATAEGSSTMEAISTTEAVIGMRDRSAAVSYASPAISISVPIAVAMPISSTVPAAMPDVARAPPSASPIPAVPRAGADEDATDEPAWAVEAIGCAGIWVVAVITIGADRSWTVGVARGVPLIVVPAISIAVALVILSLSALHEREWCHQ